MLQFFFHAPADYPLRPSVPDLAVCQLCFEYPPPLKADSTFALNRSLTRSYVHRFNAMSDLNPLIREFPIGSTLGTWILSVAANFL